MARASIRAMVAVVAALLLAVQVMRTAVVSALARTRPAEAAQYWRGHPDVELSLVRKEIARSAARGGLVQPSLRAMLSDASAKEPLAAEPFIIGGLNAELGGDRVTAKRLFAAAQWRDPRSVTAVSLPGHRYSDNGDIPLALVKTETVSRPGMRKATARTRTVSNPKVVPDG